MKITVEKTCGFHCEECGRIVGDEEKAVVLYKKDGEEVKNLLRVAWRLVPAYEPI